jgi:methylmalonyl-CoA/ethylmalonyl-CoA epimerase
MGMTVEGRFENPEVGFRGLAFGAGRHRHFEVLEPYDGQLSLPFPQGTWSRLHHVTFEVEDIDRTARAITDYGIEPMGGVQRSHGWAETYIHPKDSGGVLFQFYVEEEHHHHPDEDEDISHSHGWSP